MDPPRTPVADSPLAELTARLSRLADPLFACALVRAADREIALEATQEALVAGVRAGRSRSWPDEEALWAWLLAVLRNKLVDQYRKRGKKRAALTDEALTTALGSGVDSGTWPADAAGSAESVRLCRSALSALAPGPRTLLSRHYLEGVPQTDLARELGISPKAVESRMARARAALRTELRKVIDQPEELL